MDERGRSDTNTAVLILDDGELDDVQVILDKLGFSYRRLRGGSIAEDTPPPSDLLISTPRRIRSVEPSTSRLPLRIVVVNEDSPTLRTQLRDVGLDYLVRRPVHPEALRLLLLHCLYAGEERRESVRVPIGLDIPFRTGLLPRRATLVDLSSSGCRLLSPYALEPGMRIKVELRGCNRSETLSVGGRVVRIHLDERLRGEGLYSTAIHFRSMDETQRAHLERILGSHSGSRITGGQHSRTPETESGYDAANGLENSGLFASGDESADADSENRRKSRRGSYSSEVKALGHPALRVLVGRDLSVDGMRIEPHPGLAQGARLHLAIFAEAPDEPIAIWATVSRDYGDHGLFLKFDAAEPEIAHKLDALVANLPAVESLHDTEVGAMGTVISQILLDE